MSIDPRRVRPGQLVRSLNSTPLGQVISKVQLQRHRDAAGARIVATGDDSAIDLVRYIAWATAERLRWNAIAPADPSEQYERHKASVGERNRAMSALARDIGELPDVVDEARKEACRRDFKLFCESYFQSRFHLAWADDHLKVISTIESVVLEGGLYAIAMPRGSGKTSLCEVAAIWAMLYGHRDFVVLIAADKKKSTDLLDAIKVELAHNDLLLEDFPEACFPIRALQGITHRAKGQLYRGQPINTNWSTDRITLPSIPASDAAGATVRVSALRAGIRGMKYTRQDGRTVRPSLVLVDDPQTDESAWSPAQCETRERILAGAILGLAGPGEKISGLMPVTVVRPDDLADRMIDRERHPEWQGDRMKMLYAFPTDDELWGKYAELLRDELARGRGMAKATAFYKKHRSDMDEGAVVAWPARFNHDELSAIQHAMNLWIRDEIAFFSEYQNAPLSNTEANRDLRPSQIMERTNWVPHRTVPLNTTTITAFIDVQDKALFYLVAAWADDFTGAVIDYGAWPEQPTQYFTLRDLRNTVYDQHPGLGREAAIHVGLTSLVDHLMNREWKNEAGGEIPIAQIMIDANWGESTEVVKTYARRSPYGGTILPSHGRGITASMMPMAEYARKPGDRIGLNWRIPAITHRHGTRHVLYDTNYWKSFVYSRLMVPVGDSGALTLFGRRPERHRMLAEHLTAEYAIRTEGRKRVVDEWKARPNTDNHLFDCMVGAAVAASLRGVALPNTDAIAPRRKSPARMSLAQKQAAKRRKSRLV